MSDPGARQCNGEALQQCDLSQVQVYLIQVPYVTPSVTLAVQVCGEEAEEGLQQGPLWVEDQAAVRVAEEPDVLHVEDVAA